MSTQTTTDGAINLAQLSVELGTNALTMSDDGTERTITCHDATITKSQLEAAVAAHVPAPPPPTDAEVIANLKARLTATEQALDDVILGALMGDFPPL